MKKNMILAGLALLFAACSNNDSDINVSNSNELVPVKVHVSGFSVSQEDFPATRAAQNVADYNGVKAVTLAFYSGSTEVLKTTQLRDDASTYDYFWRVRLLSPYGQLHDGGDCPRTRRGRCVYVD